MRRAASKFLPAITESHSDPGRSTGRRAKRAGCPTPGIRTSGWNLESSAGPSRLTGADCCSTRSFRHLAASKGSGISSSQGATASPVTKSDRGGLHDQTSFPLTARGACSLRRSRSAAAGEVDVFIRAARRTRSVPGRASGSQLLLGRLGTVPTHRAADVVSRRDGSTATGRAIPREIGPADYGSRRLKEDFGAPRLPNGPLRRIDRLRQLASGDESLAK